MSDIRRIAALARDGIETDGAHHKQDILLTILTECGVPQIAVDILIHNYDAMGQTAYPCVPSEESCRWAEGIDTSPKYLSPSPRGDFKHGRRKMQSNSAFIPKNTPTLLKNIVDEKTELGSTRSHTLQKMTGLGITTCIRLLDAYAEKLAFRKWVVEKINKFVKER